MIPIDYQRITIEYWRCPFAEASARRHSAQLAMPHDIPLHIQAEHAARSEGNQRVVEELADLYYHSLVLLAARDLSLTELEAELRRRHEREN